MSEEDNQPRYTTARLRREVEEAKRLARIHALEQATALAENYIAMGRCGRELPDAIRALMKKGIA